jgi:hypothetical protein
MPESKTQTFGSEIEFTLSACDGDVFTFTREGGKSFKVRLQPQHLPNGGDTLYEVWHREETPGRNRRLLTERGYEIVFELPLLLERNLEENGKPVDINELILRFFREMRGETFRNYPRELFR